MSFWYDLKQKTYSTDRNNSWLKAYTDKLAAISKNELTAETVERLSADSALSNSLLAESAIRENSDDALSLRIDAKAPINHASNTTDFGIGTETEHGHLKLADNLTTTDDATALSAKQGKLLNDAIILLNASRPVNLPTLAPVCADNTPIGSENWTGTGYFCNSADRKYTTNTSVTSVSGFNRFCLRPTDAVPYWHNWTPYFDHNGVAYEFFFSEARGVYETLIPQTDMTGAEIVASLRWEYCQPTRISYGKMSDLFFYDVENSILCIKPEHYFRTTFGSIEPLDNEIMQGLIFGLSNFSENSIALEDMNLTMGTIFVLVTDLKHTGQPLNSGNTIQLNNAITKFSPMSIEICDNF